MDTNAKPSRGHFTPHHHTLLNDSLTIDSRYWPLVLFLLASLWISGLPPFNTPDHSDLRKPERQVPVPLSIAQEFATGRHLDLNQPRPEESQPQNVSMLTEYKSSDNYEIPNLTFILSPEFIRRNRIPEHVIQEKRLKCEKYVQTYGPVAVQEMHKYGIPASIKLAQGLLESDVGESRLATENLNHFGIKCFSRSCTKGHCSNHLDDSHKDFFRIYTDAMESYRAHSRFLQSDRYTPLKRIPIQHYRRWAHGLKDAGYATHPKYAEKLIAIIETLNLSEWDR